MMLDGIFFACAIPNPMVRGLQVGISQAKKPIKKPLSKTGAFIFLAETEGFEPSIQV